MPSTFSPEFIERLRQPPPPPFVNWRPWQRKLFAWSVMLVWVVFVGTVGIYLAVILQMPACRGPGSSNLFNPYCHTSIGVALGITALLVLLLIYWRFLEIVGRIAYLPQSNFDIDEG
jgi:hypothetical protein